MEDGDFRIFSCNGNQWPFSLNLVFKVGHQHLYEFKKKKKNLDFSPWRVYCLSELLLCITVCSASRCLFLCLFMIAEKIFFSKVQGNPCRWHKDKWWDKNCRSLWSVGSHMFVSFCNLWVTFEWHHIDRIYWSAQRNNSFLKTAVLDNNATQDSRQIFERNRTRNCFKEMSYIMKYKFTWLLPGRNINRLPLIWLLSFWIYL